LRGRNKATATAVTKTGMISSLYEHTSKRDAEYVDRNNTILCDAKEGCCGWYHFVCEGLTLYAIGDIDLYACTGCLKMGLGETTYKGYNHGSEIPDDNVEDEEEVEEEEEDEDERYSEYDDENASACDSGDSVDSDDPDDSDDSSDHQEPVSGYIRKRKADAQPVLALKVQKKVKLTASVEKKHHCSTRGGSCR